MITPQPLSVGGILTTPGHIQERVYMIESICLGALDQEDIVELSVVDRSAPDAHGKRQSMFVPKEMIEAGITAGIFTRTDAI